MCGNEYCRDLVRLTQTQIISNIASTEIQDVFVQLKESSVNEKYQEYFELVACGAGGATGEAGFEFETCWFPVSTLEQNYNENHNNNLLKQKKRCLTIWKRMKDFHSDCKDFTSKLGILLKHVVFWKKCFYEIV